MCIIWWHRKSVFYFPPSQEMVHKRLKRRTNGIKWLCEEGNDTRAYCARRLMDNTSWTDALTLKRLLIKAHGKDPSRHKPVYFTTFSHKHSIDVPRVTSGVK
ncbi:hypothetical protein XELAEV_18046782mg [Xenopus laevis]|uniref:Uncharacterized protein n=1 Tax=Xenopus laevis TaxID=8355 RepID=A0A974BTX9_XENLA|nr:hypothetical protein XELAEV_18046782mg [Xenopus laevis]